MKAFYKEEAKKTIDNNYFSDFRNHVLKMVLKELDKKDEFFGGSIKIQVEPGLYLETYQKMSLEFFLCHSFGLLENFEVSNGTLKFDFPKSVNPENLIFKIQGANNVIYLLSKENNENSKDICIYENLIRFLRAELMKLFAMMVQQKCNISASIEEISEVLKIYVPRYNEKEVESVFMSDINMAMKPICHMFEAN